MFCADCRCLKYIAVTSVFCPGYINFWGEISEVDGEDGSGFGGGSEGGCEGGFEGGSGGGFRKAVGTGEALEKLEGGIAGAAYIA